MLLASFFIDIIGSTVFLTFSKKIKLNIWLCLMLLCSALTAITAYFKAYISYNVTSEIIGINLVYFLKINEFLYSFSHYMYWYVCFAFAIRSRVVFSSRIKNQGTILLLFLFIPMLSSFFISAYTQNKHMISFITVWTSIYWFISNIVAINTYRSIVSTEQKKLYSKVLLYFFTITTYVWLTNHIVYTFAPEKYWNIANYVGILQTVLFIFLFINYGLQLYKIEVYNSEVKIAIDAMQISTSFINHFIKNEANKIALYVHLINNSLQSPKELNINHLSVIDQSSKNLLLMSQRINLSVNELTIKLEAHNVKELMTEVIAISECYKNNKVVKLENLCNQDVMILCDIFHIKEVLVNIIRNSIEAVEHNGSIIIKDIKKDNKYVIEIEDDGCGISKENMKHILKPFFTTKSKDTNYGIGLTYCYNVIKKHNGYLHIFNNKSGGVTVQLEFILV